MHHRSWSATLLLAAVAGCAQPLPDRAAMEAELRAATEALVAAEEAQDLDRIMPYWAPDAIVQTHGTPQVEGRAQIEALYRSMFEEMGLKEFEGRHTHIEVAASGDLGYEYGTNRFVLEGPDGDVEDLGKYLVVWKRIGGEWQVVALAFTSDRLEPVMVDGG